MKDDQKVSDIGLEEGHTIHLVNKPAKKKPAPAPATAPTGGATTTPTTGTGAGTGTGTTPPPGGLPGMGAFGGMGGGFPSMLSGGGPTGMGGLNMDPNQIQQMMQNPMV